jgi:hypothetical protein
MDYHSVQVRKADVERLTQEARGNHAPTASPPQQTPQSIPDAANAPAAEAGPLTKKVASVLLNLYPDGRPTMRLEELAKHVREAGGKQLGEFRLTTLRRAMRLLGWPMRQTAPNDDTKPRQT